MPIVLKLGFIAVIVFAVFFASWYVVNGDVRFGADIGRDFHLLRELDSKKLMFIGPRSSTGLFHGPAWSYLNYPAYLVGNGNPVVVGWNWLLLSALFVIGNFFIAKSLFGRLSAYMFASMTAVYMGYHTSGMFNPHGAMFLIPLYFFLFIKYVRTKNIKLLLLHFVIGGLILQFQLALGIPLLILSVLYLFFSAFRKRNAKHLIALMVLPLLVLNFIIFDLRHEFLYSSKVLSFITVFEKGEFYNYSSLINNRISMALNGVEVLRHDAYKYLNIIFFISVLSAMIFLIRKGKHKDIYLSFLYFYFGFFVLSFIDKGPILYFYIFPLFPLVFLMMASFLDTKFKNYLIIPLVMILLINILNGFMDIKKSVGTVGSDERSWKFLYNSGLKAFESDREFGYFVYSPDSLAYEGKYAMIYLSEQNGNRGHYFKKMPVTYILAAPTPVSKFVTGDEWWTKNRIKISKSPTSIITFPNGYKLERYELTHEDIKIPFDPEVDTGLLFR